MRYVLEYTRENRDIVSSEINAIKETFRDFDIIYKSDFIYIIEGNYRDIENSGFINYISQIIDEKPDYNEFNCKIPEGKFYVRASVPPGYNTEMVESTVGKILGGRGRISFNNPDFIVRAVKADIWYLGILVYSRNKKDFESRRAPLRPFFSPVSLHPKYARYLINTSYTRPGDTVLDPFCGTGGILIEAALMGRRIIGNDALLNMVMGTKLNLKY
ncbi:DNA methyltransferase, partial [Acidiplasma sp.]